MRPHHFSYNNYNSRLPIPLLGLAILLPILMATPTSSCMEETSLQFLDGLSQDAGLTKSWKAGTDCCYWEGVTCNRNKTITGVSLASRGLEGHISQSLGSPTGLQYLNLSYNSLSGGLALEVVLSTSITILDVSFNQLKGDMHELPSSTPAANPVKVLNISSNMFTGSFIYTAWKKMKNLVALNASNNNFTGQLPGHFCNISPSFVVLELCYNKFSGSIPIGLGSCTKLRVLKAGNNNLSGSLPDELFNATSLEYLSFASNDLDGVLDGACIVKAWKSGDP